MGTVVGPLTVDTTDLLGQGQQAASAIPAAIAGADAAGVHHIESNDRMGAPSWAFGYTPGTYKSWCNPARHVVAHEYAHGWWARHGRQVGGDGALRALVDHPELLGNIEGAYTNRLSEAYAHAFAAAIGVPDGVQESYFRVKIPPANYGALLALMSKALAVVTRPTHIYRRALAVALRAAPQVTAPAVEWAAFGQGITAPDGLSGGLYTLRAVDGTGSQSRLWLAVIAHPGQLLAVPLYTAELAWASLAAEPASPPS